MSEDEDVVVPLIYHSSIQWVSITVYNASIKIIVYVGPSRILKAFHVLHT